MQEFEVEITTHSVTSLVYTVKVQAESREKAEAAALETEKDDWVYEKAYDAEEADAEVTAVREV